MICREMNFTKSVICVSFSVIQLDYGYGKLVALNTDTG